MPRWARKPRDLNAELAPKKRPAGGQQRCAALPVVDDEADDQALRDLEQQAAPQPAPDICRRRDLAGTRLTPRDAAGCPGHHG